MNTKSQKKPPKYYNPNYLTVGMLQDLLQNMPKKSIVRLSDEEGWCVSATSAYTTKVGPKRENEVVLIGEFDFGAAEDDEDGEPKGHVDVSTVRDAVLRHMALAKGAINNTPACSLVEAGDCVRVGEGVQYLGESESAALDYV